MNLAGLAGQLGTLGIAVGQGVLEQLAAEADEKRLERILKELQQQNDRVDNIASRLQEAKPDSPESQKSQDSQTTSEESTADNPLAVAATKIGSKVDNLGSKLDPKYQSQPFELDKDASVSEQLRTVALDTQYRKRDFATPVIFMRVQDGYLFKRQVVKDESQGNKAASESSQQPAAQGGTQITQNVQQYGEKSMNFGQASNFRIGDDYYQSEPSKNKNNQK